MNGIARNLSKAFLGQLQSVIRRRRAVYACDVTQASLYTDTVTSETLLYRTILNRCMITKALLKGLKGC